jgi:hypothetical protein
VARFETEQRAADGLLVERIGRIELRFRLVVDAGALVFRQQGAELCLGRLRLRLPRWLAPTVSARAWRDAEGGSLRVAVEVCVPLVGRVLAYTGRLDAVAEAA